MKVYSTLTSALETTSTIIENKKNGSVNKLTETVTNLSFEKVNKFAVEGTNHKAGNQMILIIQILFLDC